METTTLYTGKFIVLRKTGAWEYVERAKATGVAFIAALTPEHKLLLVEQYRVPVQARVIELPAGIIGDENSEESHAEAAKRELLEETGYEAEEIAALVTGPTSSGLTSEKATLFRATKLRRVGDGGGVEGENITVHEVPLKEVDHWLRAKAEAGVLIDPRVYAALYFLMQTK